MGKRRLSAGQSRTDLITGWQFGAADPAAPTDPSDAPSEADADSAVTSALADAKTAVDKALAAQKGDPGDGTDPEDVKVSTGLAALSTQLETVMADQDADNKAGVPAAPAATAARARALAAADDNAGPVAGDTPTGDVPNTSPVDENGNVDNNAKCANPDCGHFASGHDDLDGGNNTGPCGMGGCDCPAMQVDTSPNNDPDDSDGSDDTTGGPNNDGGDADPGNTVDDQLSVSLDGITPVVDAPPPAEATPATPPELNLPPEVVGGDSMGPAFTIPVAVIEGQDTGDGRALALESLEWRVPPLPLMGLATETHDPEGWDLNDPAVWCGRIDSFERVPGEGDTQVIMAKGFYLPNDDGMYFAELNEAMGRLGISADIAADTSEISIGGVDETGFPIDITDTVTKGTIMGLTVVPYAAFQGAYIVLGDGTDGGPPAIAQASEPDAASTPPPATPAIVAAGGQFIHYMTYEECVPCQSGIDVIVAAGGPLAPPKSWFDNPNFTIGDDRLAEIVVTDPRTRRKVAGRYAAPMQVTDDGRVFGHIAPWEACHVGISNKCVVAPHSRFDYADFKRTQHVMTAEGEKVRTGVITAGLGHAGMTLRSTAAMAHYDDTRFGCADVAIGEDEFGIWVAGAIRPTATPEQVRILRASGISGDWRDEELVALLAVNEPGFPMAVVASGHRTLVAAGASVMAALANPVGEETDPGDVTLRRALGPLLGQAKGMARDRIAALSNN